MLSPSHGAKSRRPGPDSPYAGSDSCSTCAGRGRAIRLHGGDDRGRQDAGADQDVGRANHAGPMRHGLDDPPAGRSANWPIHASTPSASCTTSRPTRTTAAGRTPGGRPASRRRLDAATTTAATTAKAVRVQPLRRAVVQCAGRRRPRTSWTKTSAGQRQRRPRGSGGRTPSTANSVSAAARSSTASADEQAEDHLGEAAVDRRQVRPGRRVEQDAEAAEQPLRDDGQQRRRAEPAQPAAAGSRATGRPPARSRSSRRRKPASGASARPRSRTRLGPTRSAAGATGSRPDRVRHADLEGRDHAAQSHQRRRQRRR